MLPSGKLNFWSLFASLCGGFAQTLSLTTVVVHLSRQLSHLCRAPLICVRFGAIVMFGRGGQKRIHEHTLGYH